MNIYSCTDKGQVRSSNQDAFTTGTFDDGTVWAVVCDGMGGANGGNVASRLAVDHFSASFKSGYRSDMSESSVKNLLDSAISAANIRIFDKSKENSELNGMGTTIVVAVVIKNTVYFAHAGDSRAYIYSNGELTQITRDHSIVQSMIENGKISPEEARSHPRKNVITRALGVDESVNVEFNVCDISSNDIILMCTDGLSNYVDKNIISNILSNNKTGNKAELLISEANNNGGGDNITAIVLENI